MSNLPTLRHKVCLAHATLCRTLRESIYLCGCIPSLEVRHKLVLGVTQGGGAAAGFGGGYVRGLREAATGTVGDLASCDARSTCDSPPLLRPLLQYYTCSRSPPLPSPFLQPKCVVLI